MFRFKSQIDTMVYARSSEAWLLSTGMLVADAEYAMYDSLGDGMTQHTPLTWVPTDRFVDLMESLYVHLMEHPEDIKEACDVWHHHDNPTLVRFAMKVKWRDDKRMYYSTTFEKVSSSDKKQYDTRWKEVPDWADGSPLSVFRIMHESTRSLTHMMTYYTSLLRTMREVDGSYYGEAELYVFGDLYREQRILHGQVFRAVRKLMEAERLRHDAERSFECFTGNREHWSNQKKEENAA